MKLRCLAVAMILSANLQLSEERMQKKTVRDIEIKGKKAIKGERMTTGRGWKLAATTGRKRVFSGTLLGTYNIGSSRIAIFSVPK